MKETRFGISERRWKAPEGYTIFSVGEAKSQFAVIFGERFVI